MYQLTLSLTLSFCGQEPCHQREKQELSITKLISSAPHSSAMLNDRWHDSSDAVVIWSNLVPTTRIGMEDSANCSASKSQLNIPHKYISQYWPIEHQLTQVLVTTATVSDSVYIICKKCKLRKYFSNTLKNDLLFCHCRRITIQDFRQPSAQILLRLFIG